MAQVVSIDGPDYNGNYKAKLDNGETITFGPVQDPKHQSPDAPETMWFVSLPASKDHTTYILECRNGIWQSNSEWMIKAVKEKGDDKGTWRLYANSIVNGPPR